MATQVVGTQQPKIGTTGTAEDNEKKLNELQKIQKEINDLSEEALTADEARREQIRERIAVLQQEEAEYKKILDYVKGINKESEPKTYDVTFAGPEESEFEKLQRSLAIQQADKIQAVDIASLTNLMQVAMQHGIDSLNLDFSAIYNRMLNGENIPDDVWTSLERTINEKLKELKLPQIELDITTGGVKQASADVSKLSTEWVQAAQAVGQFGSALQSVEDPTAKIAGIIAQAIASVAAGAGSAIAEAGTGSAGGPWGWIAFAISATATMVSTIAAIKSATSANYAQGGIVGGNSFSGDNMRGILPNGELIGLNSGETVLTAAQTGVLANAMKSNPMGNLNIEGILDGETIRLVLVNNALRRGGNRGEYAITKFG